MARLSNHTISFGLRPQSDGRHAGYFHRMRRTPHTPRQLAQGRTESASCAEPGQGHATWRLAPASQPAGRPSSLRCRR
jgi:hypothetical protein